MKSLTILRERQEVVENPSEPLAAAPFPIDPAVPWFAAQTNPRREVHAMHGIAALGWRTFVPFGWKWTRPRHAPSHLHVLRRRPGMPGYLFMIAPTDTRGDVRLAEARGIDGIKCIVSQSGRPLPIRAQAIELLMKAESAGVYDFNAPPPRGKLWDLKPGDRIKIISGAGEGMLGTVSRRSNAREVEVRDDVFGMRLAVPLDRLMPIEL